jgi:hypothetical protein
VFSILNIEIRLTGREPIVIHNEQGHLYEIWVDDVRVGHGDDSFLLDEKEFGLWEVVAKRQGESYAVIFLREAFWTCVKIQRRGWGRNVAALFPTWTAI